MTGTGKRRVKKQGKPLSAQQLLEQAQECLEFDDYEGAREKYATAATQEPNNVEVLDAYGSFLAEVGAGEEAAQVLRRAVALAPDKGYEKYMYLGQLSEGEDGLVAMRTGIQILEHDLHEASSTGLVTDAAELRTALCGALCSLAEMQLHSATDITQVAPEVGMLLERAQALDTVSPEPLQALASLRYEEGRPEEALSLLRESMKHWFKPDADDGASEGETDDEDDDEAMEDRRWRAQAEELGLGSLQKSGSSHGKDTDMREGGTEREVPSYEFRIETAKLLLELDENTDAALQVLQDLIAENDSVPEVWHLLAMAHYGAEELDEALEVIESCRQLLAKQGAAPDHELHVILSDLEAAVQQARVQCDAEDVQ